MHDIGTMYKCLRKNNKKLQKTTPEGSTTKQTSFFVNFPILET